MTSQISLKALYYPYARCTDEGTLKRAILIFDEVGFVDPTSPKIRDGLITDKREVAQSVMDDWKVIRDAYGVLLERDIVKLHDPEALIAEHDELLSGALKADLDDNEMWQLCTGDPGQTTSWSILRRKVPKSAFKYLNSQVSPRVGFVIQQAEDRVLESNFENFSEYYRYVFHDRKVAEERDAKIYIKDAQERELYLKDFEFSCVFPYLHGSSLSTNTALLLAETKNLLPFTDSKLHHRMVTAKYRRAAKQIEEQTVPLHGVTPFHPEKIRRTALTLLETVVPDECIQHMSIPDCIRYREANIDTFARLKEYIGELVSQLESEPWTQEFEREVQGIVHQRIVPEARRAKDKGIDVYEKLFGKLAKRTSFALTPALVASVLADLSLSAMLVAGSAATFGAVLPDLIDTVVEKRTANRNSLTYLLAIRGHTSSEVVSRW